MAEPRKKKYLWRADGEPTGHSSFCVAPNAHNAGLTYCSASPSEPATMRGGASKAYRDDHPTADKTEETT